MNYKIVIKATILTFCTWVIWFAANAFLPPQLWEGMELSKSAITVEYCEFNNPKAFFHQSINTYSNLAYFFFGTLLVLIGMRDRKTSGNFLQQFPSFTILVGICMIYLSVGSAFFHASLTWIGQRVDMNGTYGITILLVALGLVHLFKKAFTDGQKQKASIILLVVFILSFYEIALHVSSGVLIPVLILSSLVLMLIEYFKNRNKKSILLILLSFSLIIVAIKIRTLDVQKIGCDPLSFFQGHSLWHLLTAMSSFVTYSFYRFDYE